VADRIIYVDHAGTTPVHPEVAAAMRPYFEEQFGNPSSLHGLGAESAAAVDAAREAVAEVLNARSGEIVFTSGGSESVNTALKGVAFAQQLAGAGNRIVSTGIEHHAVLHTLDYLERFGFETVRLEVDAEGFVTPDQVAAAVDDQTVLVSVMLANNEVGTVEPIAEIAAALVERGRELGRRIPFHTDAVQGAGQLPLDVRQLGVDLLSISAHKFRGPKGAGALFLRRGTPFLAQQTGGGQERNRRAGTENVPGIVGMARALTIAETQRDDFVRHVTGLRDHLFQRCLAEIPGAVRNGPRTPRLPNNANVHFVGVDGQWLLDALDAVGIAASSGSACTTSSWEPSHVLLAMGADQDEAAGSLRVTLGMENTRAEIDFIVDQLARIVPELRAGVVAGEPTSTLA
jgi:cysteine desulfurase